MDRPAISIAASFDYTVPFEKQVPLIARAGFTHIATGADPGHSGIHDPEKRPILKKLLSENSIAIDTIHSTHFCRPEYLERITADIEAAVDLEVPVVVVHPGPFEIDPARYDELFSRLTANMRQIEPLLKETGLKIALENMVPGPATDLAVQALEQNDSPYYGFCYDSAHDQIDGPRPFDLLKKMKDRLFAVHLSDRIRPFVDHVPPGEGFIDWTELTSLLRKAPFDGPWLFEVMTEHSSVKETKPFLKLSYERAFWVYNSIIHLPG